MEKLDESVSNQQFFDSYIRGTYKGKQTLEGYHHHIANSQAMVKQNRDFILAELVGVVSILRGLVDNPKLDEKIKNIETAALERAGNDKI